MAAVWMRLRAELRARWRAWVALAVIFGVAAGGAIAAIAGARRTDTAYPRFVKAQDGFHAYTGGGGSRGFEARFAALKGHPAIEDFVEFVVVGAEVTIPARRGRPEAQLRFPDLLVSTDPSGRALYEINRAKLLDGRFADRSRADEAMVPFLVAERYGLEIGDEMIAGVGFDEEKGAPVDHVPLRVVGIYAAPGDFEALGQQIFVSVAAMPALYEKYQAVLPRDNPDIWSLGLHLRAGSEGAVSFKQAVERDLNIDVPIIEPIIRSGVQKVNRLYTTALWLLGSLIAVATVAIVGQTLARQQALESSEYPTLRAMGMSRGQLLGLGMMRAGIIGVGAAALATLVPYLLSPLTPIGPPRTAEPDPGFAFDATALGLGAAAVLVIVPLITLIPSLRAARSAAKAEGPAAGAIRPSRIARTVGRMSRSPATSTGLRMALEPGRGRTSVPIRSTILAVALGVAAVGGSVVVGRSLTHLIETPALTGFTYDAILPGGYEAESPEDPAVRVARLKELPFVEKAVIGTLANAVFGNTQVFLLGFEDGGEIGYAVIDGRAPLDAPDGSLPEIALGPGTIRRVGLRIGDSVEFGYPDPTQTEEEESGGPIVRRLLGQRARIVGVAAVPSFPFAVTEPGEGAIMSAGAIARFNLGEPGGCCFVAFKPGTDLVSSREQLEDAGFEVFLREQRTDLATLEKISRLPALLSAIFAAIAAAALAHVLVTAVRRRRRDLAILKTLGFVKRQIRSAIAWQVSAIAVLSVMVGIPAGIMLGRWAWRLIAAQFGVVPVSVAPVFILTLVLPAALVLGNLVGAIPGRVAARTKPALVLRAE